MKLTKHMLDITMQPSGAH